MVAVPTVAVPTIAAPTVAAPASDLTEARLLAIRAGLLDLFAAEAAPFGATATDVVNDYLQGRTIRPAFARILDQHLGRLGLPREIVSAELDKLVSNGAATGGDLRVLLDRYGPDPTTRQANEVLTFAKRLAAATRARDRRKREALELVKALGAREVTT